MSELPIDATLPQILEALRGRSVVVVAPPGSGKTTRVPPAILKAGLLSSKYPTAIVLQPRRIAARAAAARIAEENGWTVGEEVGYQIRLDRRFSRNTRLRFVTEGILTRQMLADPFLENVGAVILDEFHERNLNSDLALALLREIRREVRPDLILVVMSATLDAEPVARFLDDCPIIRAEGRSYAVSVDYRPVDRPASTEAMVPVIEEQLDDPRAGGHILVFLPGIAEIRRLEKRLAVTASRCGAVVLPLHGSLPADDQDRALKPSDRRKVILSTNVAETSLTIDGVSTVIDCGLARIVQYDAQRGVDRWELGRISRAAAAQRAGRAGRTGPGRCIRLWSERDQSGRPEFEEAEVHRIDLSALVLALHAWGTVDLAQFDWFDRPSLARLASAERLLVMLGALAGDPARISELGKQLLSLPVHPRLARLLVVARECGRGREGATVAALLSERDIRSRNESVGPEMPQMAATSRSDVVDRVDMLALAERMRFSPSLRSRGIDPSAARQVALVRDDLLGRDRHREPKVARSSDETEDDEVLKWLLLAYPDRVVKRRGVERTGVMVGGRGVRLGPESRVRDAEWYLALDAREDRRAGVREVSVSLASTIEIEWLLDLFPAAIRREQLTYYDESRSRVVCAHRLWYHDLLLREDTSAAVDVSLAGRVLAQALRPEAARLVRARPSADSWLTRLNFVAHALPELSWPEFDDDILADVLEAACQGRISKSEIETADFVPYLETRLDRGQLRDLKESAPLALTVPSGKQVRLTYEPRKPPILAVRLQELFGWTETPRVARGRVAVLLHLLGPNNRPVQITDDLRSFWTTTYHQVRKELRGRYPKHAWPEDPFKAERLKKGKPK